MYFLCIFLPPFSIRTAETFQNVFGGKIFREFLSILDLWLLKSDPLEPDRILTPLCWRKPNPLAVISIFMPSLCSVFSVSLLFISFQFFAFMNFNS